MRSAGFLWTKGVQKGYFRSCFVKGVVVETPFRSEGAGPK